MLTRLTVIALCCSMLAVGQDVSTQLTAGELWNGRFWVTLDNKEKIFFILGMMEGLNLVSWDMDKETKDKIDDRTSAKTLTVGDFIKALDKLYTDPANVQIPLILLWKHSVSAYKGKTTNKQQENLLMLYRSAFSK